MLAYSEEMTFISPGGNATIEQDDKVILVTTNQLLDDLNDILE